MKEKIRNLVKDRKFQIGVVVGATIVWADYNQHHYRLARQGFKLVKPNGVGKDGHVRFEDINGQIFHVKNPHQ